jgi:hypothetical protein
MEIGKTAIGKLRSVNDPLFQPHAHQAERVDFEAICEAYPERDFTFPDLITDDKCRAWLLKKPHFQAPPPAASSETSGRSTNSAEAQWPDSGAQKSYDVLSTPAVRWPLVW